MTDKIENSKMKKLENCQKKYITIFWFQVLADNVPKINRIII